MSAPIRILHVVTKMNRAGLETMLMNYYRHIDRNKVQFDFLTHRSEQGDYDQEILALGGRIFHVPSIHPKHFIQYLKALADFFEEHTEYQIVHSHIDALSTFPLFAAKKAGVPIRIAHSHTTNFDKDSKLPLRLISRSMIPFVATHFFGCSKEAVQFMFGKRVCQQKGFNIIHNAIDTVRFRFNAQTRKDFRTMLGLDEKFVIGHVGSFTYPKNHEFLIDIFHQVYQNRPNSVLLLIGKGENEQAIRSKVAALGLEEAVYFLGGRDDIPQLMWAMDAFVFPSRFEGLGIVLLEAQATGLPCFTSEGVVPQAAKVTDLLINIPLSAPPKHWASVILSGTSFDRKDTSRMLKSAGYEITEQAQALVEFYCNCLK